MHLIKGQRVKSQRTGYVQFVDLNRHRMMAQEFTDRGAAKKKMSSLPKIHFKEEYYSFENVPIFKKKEVIELIRIKQN